MFDPNEFGTDEVKELLTQARELVMDNYDDLAEFAYDLQQIINHATYLREQCEDRCEELDGPEDDEE